MESFFFLEWIGGVYKTQKGHISANVPIEYEVRMFNCSHECMQNGMQLHSAIQASEKLIHIMN